MTTSQMQSKNINLIYQNLIILLGKKIFQNWVMGNENEEIEEEIDIPNNEILRSKYNNSFGLTKEEVQENQKIDYIEIICDLLKSKYGEKSAEKFIDGIKKVLVAIGYNRSESQKQIILEEQEKIREKLKIMQDNKKYIEKLSKKKIELAKDIGNIDVLLSDEELLKQEYSAVNSKLPNKEKIFSVSHFRIMLEKQRKKELEQIEVINTKMKPAEFVKTKKELEEKEKFFDYLEINESQKANEEKAINDFQQCFLECFMQKIEKAENKTELKKLIYELRYYEQLPYKNSVVTKINTEIEQIVENVEEKLIKNACKEKVLTTFTQNENLNSKITTNIFKTRIINLENINYILKYHKGILKIEIFDTDIEEETKEIQITEKVELEVKLNKKIKVLE